MSQRSERDRPDLKSPAILAWVVIAIMGVCMVNVVLNSGMDHGVGFDTFLAGTADPWQVFINNDLVTGLLFMVGWLVVRESGGAVLPKVAWIWMILWWGNIVVAAYVLWCARSARGDWAVFFLGRRAGAVPAFAPGKALRVISAAGAVLTLGYLAWGLASVQGAPIAIFGYIAGFVPIVLSLGLIALHRA